MGSDARPLSNRLLNSTDSRSWSHAPNAWPLSSQGTGPTPVRSGSAGVVARALSLFILQASAEQVECTGGSPPSLLRTVVEVLEISDAVQFLASDVVTLMEVSETIEAESWWRLMTFRNRRWSSIFVGFLKSHLYRADRNFRDGLTAHGASGRNFEFPASKNLWIKYPHNG